MALAFRPIERRIVTRPLLLTLLLVIAAAILGLALFFAGAAWRARVTSPRLSMLESDRLMQVPGPNSKELGLSPWQIHPAP